MIPSSDRFPPVPTDSRNQSTLAETRLVPTGSRPPYYVGVGGTSRGTSRGTTQTTPNTPDAQEPVRTAR